MSVSYVCQLLHVASMQIATLPGSPAAVIAEARMQLKLADKHRSSGGGHEAGREDTAAASSSGPVPSASSTASSVSASAIVNANPSTGDKSRDSA